MGLSGNILVKSNVPKSKSDNVFDIKESNHCTKYHDLRHSIY